MPLEAEHEPAPQVLLDLRRHRDRTQEIPQIGIGHLGRRHRRLHALGAGRQLERVAHGPIDEDGKRREGGSGPGPEPRPRRTGLLERRADGGVTPDQPGTRGSNPCLVEQEPSRGVARLRRYRVACTRHLERPLGHPIEHHGAGAWSASVRSLTLDAVASRSTARSMRPAAAPARRRNF